MRKFIYLLPFAIMALSSCLKDSTDTTPLPVPSGTFTGEFRKIHKNLSTSKLDTVKISFKMKMSIDSGYKVLSDTTTIHAGSKGDFQINSVNIYFVDSTYPKTGTPTKIHLAGGPYPYQYNGTALQFYTSIGDTIAYQYDLKKTN